MLITTCGCPVHDAAVRRSKDPTGLTVARRRYEREMVRRFTALKRAIRQAIVTLDVLGLKQANNATASMFKSTYGGRGGRMTRDAAPVLAPGIFANARRSDKIASFMQWLYEAEQEGILDIIVGTPVSTAASTAWQNVYIDTAYQKGIRDAYSRLSTNGKFFRASFNDPVHADAAGLIYTRAYNGLVGITDAMDTAISRTLAQAMLEGRGAAETASALENAVDGIGITRARTLARTEMTSAYAEATLNAYEEMGVDGVEVEVEFGTAGDDSVCPECEELEGKTFTIDESRGVIPVHPNCRCAWLPVVSDDKPQSEQVFEREEN